MSSQSQSVPIAVPVIEPREQALSAFWARLTLPVLLAWQLMVLLDATIVNIALADIRQSLDFSAAGLSWVVNSYALAFGGLLLLGGRAGDILGRRRMLIWGVIVFTAASVLGGVAQNAEMLLLARVAQGVGAAMAAPSTLSLIYTNFTENDARNRALSLFGAVSGVGASIGLIVGGLLTSSLSWHWVFFINVPIGIAVAFAAPRALKESPRNPGRFDIAGAALSTVGVSAIVYGFIRASEESWTEPVTMASFAIGVVLLVALVLTEARAAQPIMPLTLFTNRNRVVSLVNMLLISSAMFGVFFFVTQFLQIVHGFSPVRSGFAFLPMSLSVLTAARLAPMMINRFGTHRLMIAGAISMTLGLAALSQVTVDGNYWVQIVVPFMLIGFGGGSSFIPMNLTIMSTLRPEQTGAGAGALQTFQQVGGAVGLAVLVSIFTAGESAAVEDGLAALPAMVDGLRTAFLAASGVTLFAAVMLVVGLRERK